MLHLFDHTVVPIPLYGCEILGAHNVKVIEACDIKFLKQIMKLRKSTPSAMVYGELDRAPVYVII